MKRIITALGNVVLNNELNKYSKYDVISEDFFYQEGLLDFLSSHEVDVIVISGLLQGQFNLVDFVSEIRKLSFGSRIIVIVESINEQDKNLIISKGVFDILYDASVEIQDVLEAIDREDPINIRAQIESQANQIKEAIQENANLNNITDITNVVSKTQRQEIIGVYGTAGSGKSTLICSLVKRLSNKTKAKILLIDFDTLNGNLDELLQVSKIPQNVELIIDDDKKCGINYVADLCLKNRFDANVLDEVVIKCNSFDFLSGNTSLHYCQNVLNENLYGQLLKCAKEKYDFIFLDLSSNIFLDSTKWALKECNRVIFVTENTNICLKKSLQSLDTIFNVWNVYKGKFSLVINRQNSSAIDVDVMSEILGLEMIGKIKDGAIDNVEAIDKILSTLNYVPKQSLISKLPVPKVVFSSLFTSFKGGV